VRVGVTERQRCESGAHGTRIHPHPPERGHVADRDHQRGQPGGHDLGRQAGEGIRRVETVGVEQRRGIHHRTQLEGRLMERRVAPSSVVGERHIEALQPGPCLLHEHGRGEAPMERHRDGRAHRWVTRERQLLDHGPDAVSIARRRIGRALHERGLGLSHPQRDQRHPLVRHVVRLEDHGQQVAAAGCRGEHLEQIERVRRHVAEDRRARRDAASL
jgi:hypothetical protein